jgi:hypothetical protein
MIPAQQFREAVYLMSSDNVAQAQRLAGKV